MSIDQPGHEQHPAAQAISEDRQAIFFVSVFVILIAYCIWVADAIGDAAQEYVEAEQATIDNSAPDIYSLERLAKTCPNVGITIPPRVTESMTAKQAREQLSICEQKVAALEAVEVQKRRAAAINALAGRTGQQL